jgi:outer membrane autotransporter protein
VAADLDGYREGGGGPFNLAIQDQSLDSTLAELGLDWGYAASLEWGVLQPVLRAAVLHEFGDDGRLVRGTFIQDVQQLEFVVPTDAPDRDFFNLGVGLTATTYRGRSFYVFYDTDLGRDDLEVGTFTLGVRLEL